MPELLTRRAALATNSYDPATRRFTAIAATATPVDRFDWTTGRMVQEVLQISGADLGRLGSGRAPLLDSHQRYSSGDQIGVVRGARIERGNIVVDCELSSRAEVEPIAADVAAGIIANVSVGYSVNKRERLAGADGAPDTVLVTAWCPYEISIVAVGADPNAQIRTHPQRSTTMDEDEIDNGAGAEAEVRANDDGQIDPAVLEAARLLVASRGQRPAPRPKKKPRKVLYRELATVAGVGNEFVTRHLEAGTSEREFRNALLDHLATSEANTSGPTGTTQVAVLPAGGGYDAQLKPIEDALYARMSGKAPEGQAREFMGRSLLDLGAMVIEARGERVSWLSRDALAEQILTTRAPGLATTSDFPNLLTAASNRVLLESYQVAQSPLKALGRQRTANDFRAISMLRLSEAPALEKVNEHGEVKRGAASETKQGFAIATFGKIFGLTRQAIINDDLGAFSDMSRAWGIACAECEASQLVLLFTANGGAGVTLDDTNPLYVSPRNAAASGAAISVTTLATGRQAMRQTTGLDGKTPINAVPKYLLVGPQQETAGEQVLATLYPYQVSDANPFTTKLELMVEPRFSGNAYRLFADPTQTPVIEYGYLSGAQGPQMTSRLGWDVLGIEFRCVLDFGCGVSGWRGTYLNPGQ